MRTAAETLTSFYSAIEQGRHGAELAVFLADDAETIERPNALVPAGRVSDRTAMLAGSSAGAAMLSSQHYDVHWINEVGDTVVVRLTWRGVVAQPIGPFHAGQELTAHIAQFVRVCDEQITEIQTYDCYEPFG